MKLLERIQQRIFLMDGAMGTQIQARDIPASAWNGRDGCNEMLNLTAPDIIRDIHSAYYDAGSDAVETNTFGASSLTLGEYELSDKAFEINKAAATIAREAADAFSTPEKPRYVFGSIGPGTKLPTLGQISFDELCDAIQVQISGLLEGGADGILIETCQDLLQIKSALLAYDKVVGKDHMPLYVSVTVETTGTLLIGSNIGAVVTALSPFPVDILGLNCATGPEAMRNHLDYLKDYWKGYMACMPNAGMPIMTANGVDYPLKPDQFGPILKEMAHDIGLNVLGGCCGTSPAHIKAILNNMGDFCAPPRIPKHLEQASSVFAPMDLTQNPPPLYVGERANATGSKKFRETLLADDYDGAFSILSAQEEIGAHILDLSCAYAGRDEQRDMEIMIEKAAQECRLPIMVDSTQPQVIEATLKRHGGRLLINSINFEAGEEKAEQVVNLARRYGAGLVVLTIDETGMALTADRKVEIAKRLVTFCEARGLKRGDLFIDTLTFTIGSGDETLRTAAMETIEAIKRIKQDIPGVRTILGLSNISFGLKAQSRKVLNAVFLDRCIKAGMDACIINTATIAPLNQIPKDAIMVAEALLSNDQTQGDPLEKYIQFFEDATFEESADEQVVKTPEEQLTNSVVKGKTDRLTDVMPVLLETYSAEHILNEILVPAMKEVGRLFNDGILQLPFVLKSAEVMKRSVDLIKPYMKKDESGGGQKTMVLATVAGDVHDIGKNLVDIILSNNGFKVINMGTKIPIEEMIKAVREHNADVLGMSGLLVKSAAIMAESMKTLEDARIDIPVFLGGAALTNKFVADACQPTYSAPVLYCKDAFEGLARMRELSENGQLKKTPTTPAQKPRPVVEAPPLDIDLSEPAGTPPFWGHRIVKNIDLTNVYPLLNETALLRGRWGYRRNKLSAEEHKVILEKEAYPALEKMKLDCRRTGLFKAQAAYGYYRCRGKDETLYVYPKKDSDPIPLVFPRQTQSPGISIPDFFRRDEDVCAMMVVTLGPGLEAENMELLKKNNYRDYFLLHGFAVEVTDALAEFWHQMIRMEMGYQDGELSSQDYITQQYRGSRYGFGYPACPDLSMNKICCDLVHAEEIGIGITDNSMMTPEVTTSALIAFHPKANYFYV